MRELKFRAWHKDSKEMLEVYSLGFGKTIHPDTICSDPEGSHDTWTNDELVIEQYIGLPDCKETDIYEGDIVLVCESMVGDMVIPEAYCEVVFADGMYVAVGPGEYDWYPMDKNTIAAYEMVVKGNIHLNKDLIKKK